MSEISFYHLQKSPLEMVLPRLLEKTLESDKRAVVMMGSAERVEFLNNVLWTYKKDSWLPHGNAKDGHAELQPIWLTVEDENPNQAAFLFLADGAQSNKMNDYERCFELFDGNDPDAVSAARERWKVYQDAGHGVTYWSQNDQGGWEKSD
ncbi:MAG: DNA polymerase III subunit chi [Rhodospirillales bacterium]|jgi:DNA polymerase-3 subunit chi